MLSTILILETFLSFVSFAKFCQIFPIVFLPNSNLESIFQENQIINEIKKLATLQLLWDRNDITYDKNKLLHRLKTKKKHSGLCVYNLLTEES